MQIASFTKIFLLTTVLQQTHCQNAITSNGSELWRLSIDFLVALNSQKPLKRLIAVYEEQPTEPKSNFPLVDLCTACSERGIFLSAVKISSPLAISYLRPDQPPLVCALFLTSAAASAAFLKEATQRNGNIFWIFFSRGKTPSLDFLRADANFLLVLLESGGKSAKIQRWNGFGFGKNVIAWKKGDKRIDPKVLTTSEIIFTGQSLSVAVFHDPPFIILPEKSELIKSAVVSKEEIRGWLVDLWSELQTRLNFTSSFYRPSSQSGGLLKKAVEELTSGRADVVLAPFAPIHGDEQKVDFTLPFTTLNYRFVVARVSAISSFTQYLQPFPMNVWRATAAILALAVILMATCFMVGLKFGLGLKGRPFYGFYESALIINGSLLAQGIISSISGRIILWSCYAFGVVLGQVYAAALISKLALGILQPPFANFEGMLSSPFSAVVVEDSAPHRLILGANAGAWKEMRERKPYFQVVSNLETGLAEVSGSWTSKTLLEAKERLVPKLMDSPLNCQLILAASEAAKFPASILTAKMSPFVLAFNQRLALMRTSGQLTRLRTKWLGRHFSDDCCSKNKGPPQFEMENVALPFYVLVGAFIAGFLLLFAEFLIKKWLWDQLRPLEILRQIALNSSFRGNGRVHYNN